jgi:hypothetical protein
MTTETSRSNGYTGHGQKYGRLKEQAISALMTSPTIEAAADQVEVDKSTLYRWLDRDDFQRDYKRARREALTRSIARLQKASTEAVETLQEVMNDTDAKDSTRVRAAEKVMKFAIEAAEIEDMQERLDALEDVLISRGDDDET